MEAGEHAAELALRLEDELAYLARGAMARGRGGDVVRAAAHLLGRLVRCAGEAAAREHRHVDEVIAHISGRLLLEPHAPHKAAEGALLVRRALDHMLDAELARALGNRLRFAAADQRGLE